MFSLIILKFLWQPCLYNICFSDVAQYRFLLKLIVVRQVHGSLSYLTFWCEADCEGRKSICNKGGAC